jgi:hypothetical protein
MTTSGSFHVQICPTCGDAVERENCLKTGVGRERCVLRPARGFFRATSARKDSITDERNDASDFPLHHVKRIRIYLFMRKIVRTILSFLLLIAVTGVSVQVHYCGDFAQFTAIALDGKHASCCGDEATECPSCLDTIESHVLDAAITAPAQFSGVATFSHVCVLPPSLKNPLLTTGYASVCCAAGPPGSGAGVETHILVSSFLI